MLFFLDTASVREIEEAIDKTGMVDGITTNPSLIVRCGRPMEEVIRDICGLVSGPVSAEVTDMGRKEMLSQARRLAALAPNVVVKVPLTPDGLLCCQALAKEGIPVNVTLCFSTVQAVLAAKAGAAYVSPFLGRSEENGVGGAELLEEIRCAYDNAFPEGQTKILAASIRGPEHIRAAALTGADAVTMPLSVLYQLYRHVLTERGLDVFCKEWQQYEKGHNQFGAHEAE